MWLGLTTLGAEQGGHGREQRPESAAEPAARFGRLVAAGDGRRGGLDHRLGGDSGRLAGGLFFHDHPTDLGVVAATPTLPNHANGHKPSINNPIDLGHKKILLKKVNNQINYVKRKTFYNSRLV